MKLNNKGFAITIVLYGTFILFLLLIVSLLGILSTYKLRLEKLNDPIEDIIDVIPPDPKPLTCTITGTKASGATGIGASYFTAILLTVNANKPGVTYSFDGSAYSETNTKTIKKTGTITAYVKTVTEEANCQITIGSRTEYRSRTCTQANISYTSWIKNGAEYEPSCSPYGRSEAERNGSTWYRTCQQFSAGDPMCGGDLCYLRTSYSRNVFCASFEDATWSDWKVSKITETYKIDVQTRTTYKVIS